MTTGDTTLTNEDLLATGIRNERYFLGVPMSEIVRPDRLVFALPLGASVLGLVVGAALLALDQADLLALPLLALLALALGAAALQVRRTTGTSDRRTVLYAAVAAVCAVLFMVTPTWLYGWGFHAIISRTIVFGPLILVLSAAVFGLSLRALLADAPAAGDYALAVWLMIPIVAAAVAYGLLIANIVISGIGGLRWSLLVSAWHAIPPSQGFLNSILGTLLLMTLALLFAFPPAVGAGIFIAQYPGRMATVIDLAVQMVRAVPLFVLGGAALQLVQGMNGLSASSPLSVIVRGVYTVSGQAVSDQGSFVLAAAFVALVILPVIAKMTEEGLRSVPRDMKEASVALGARDGYALRRIFLPWAAPNILTGVLIAAAEANGCLALIMFITGTGANGVGPFTGATSLEWAVFGFVLRAAGLERSVRDRAELDAGLRIHGGAAPADPDPCTHAGLDVPAEPIWQALPRIAHGELGGVRSADNRGRRGAGIASGRQRESGRTSRVGHGNTAPSPLVLRPRSA